jgi:hypothetical protein
MDIEVPAGVTPADLERWLMSGAAGVRERFAAVGAGEYYYEHASARHYDQSEAELKRVLPEQVGQWSRTSSGRSRIHFSWDDCAGEMSMAAAYAEHLLTVRAHELDLLEAEEPCRPDPDRGYVEVGGRLAMREGTGLRLQPIHGRDRTSVAADAMTDTERRGWSALADGCACPGCSQHLWTAAEADALAARIEGHDTDALLELHRSFVMTPRLLDVLLRESAQLQRVVASNGQRGYWTFWRRRHLAAARPRAEALLSSDDPQVRASARSVAVLATQAPEAVEHVRAALADAPLVARASIAAWLHHKTTWNGSLASWSETLVRPLAATMVDTLTTTTDAHLANDLIGLVAWYPRVVEPDVFKRFKKSLAPWTKDPVTCGAATHAKKTRQR